MKSFLLIPLIFFSCSVKKNVQKLEMRNFSYLLTLNNKSCYELKAIDSSGRSLEFVSPQCRSKGFYYIKDDQIILIPRIENPVIIAVDSTKNKSKGFSFEEELYPFYYTKDSVFYRINDKSELDKINSKDSGRVLFYKDGYKTKSVYNTGRKAYYVSLMNIGFRGELINKNISGIYNDEKIKIILNNSLRTFIKVGNNDSSTVYKSVEH